MERTRDAVGSGPALLYQAVQDELKRYILDPRLGLGDVLPPEPAWPGRSASAVRSRM